MDRKSSSLVGPLWVVGIGLLILGMGVGFMAYVLWERKEATHRPAASPHPTSAEVRAMIYSNQAPPSGKKPSTNPAISGAPIVAPPASDSPTIALAPGASATFTIPAAKGSGTVPSGGGGPVTPILPAISGRVTLRGSPPPETPINVTDPNCGKAALPPTTTRFYIVSRDGGLADVFIYFRGGLEGRSFAIPPNAPVIDQLGCEYKPQVLGLQTGQTLLVRNSDRTLHNVHFTSTVEGNREANKAQMAGGADLPFVWPKPEVFLRLKCDVHPWMFSYIGVLEHPFFAVTGADGNFAIASVQPGRYVIEAVHRKTHGRGGNGLQREIEVKAGENLRLDFEIVLPQ